MNKIKVLFVCLGNICRSPTAEGIFRHLVKENGLDGKYEIDSAGTSHWHIGEQPDPRAINEAQCHGINISEQRSRQVVMEDFEQYDYIVGMDQENCRELRKICPKHLQHKIHLLTNYAPGLEVQGVPDPYYGGPNGFSKVFGIIEASAIGLLKAVESNS